MIELCGSKVGPGEQLFVIAGPDVIESEINTALEVLSEGNPSLDDIDKAVDAVILKPGPHLFSQSKREDAASPVTGSTGDGDPEEEE